MLSKKILLGCSSFLLLLTGCVELKPQERITHRNEKLSDIITRIQNVTHQQYLLYSKDFTFLSEETREIENFESLERYLEKKGYVVEIASNKYVTNKPKIIEVSERGKYAGSLSTVTYFPLRDKTLSDVLLDFGFTTKYTIIMDDDVLAESKMARKPSDIFTGKTASDFIKFVELAYDYHVDIDQPSAVITVKKYKSEVINILAEKSKILSDSKVFLAQDIENKKNKQFVCDNGKIFITGTPSDIEKVKSYASETNTINANKVMSSFDGQKSVKDILIEVTVPKGSHIDVLSGDFVPEKDTSTWMEKPLDIDEYIRKNYNKKITLVASDDKDADGIKDSFTYVINNIRGVSLATPCTVSSLFKQLAEIDGNYYIVDGDANIPVSKIVIDDFEHLRAYMWSTTGKKITLTDSGPGMPKVIRIE